VTGSPGLHNAAGLRYHVGGRRRDGRLARKDPPLSVSSPIPANARPFGPRTVTVIGLSREPVRAKLEDVGRGRPVVFLHGLAGLNDHWEEAIQRLCDRARCIAFELPLLHLRGDDCSLPGVVELTVRFLESHLAGTGGTPAGRTVLVGNSFGGHVALMIALSRPDLVGGLVLAGSSGLVEKTMVSEIQTRPSREWLGRRIGELFRDPARHMREADVDRAHAELTNRGCARAMVKLSKSSRKNHVTNDMGRIKAPTLVVWGRNDVVTPPEAGTEFAAKIPDARIVWFDECGHVPMVERPDDFAGAMREFLEELDAREARA
jgi:2-hydroxy-6-oxonona-2,4-dienedioate hydrolase